MNRKVPPPDPEPSSAKAERGNGPAPVRGKDDFLVFGAPAIEQAEIDEVVATLQGGWLGTGPRTAEFERRVAAYKGAAHGIGVNSCTAALHLSLVAAGIGHGDEVITTPMTFCATVNAIIHSGATPVLADIDPATLNIDPTDIERRVSERTKAIIPVHFAGRACEMDHIMAIAERGDITIIEDCAHAIETEYRGRKAGTFGKLGCLSFYVTKNIVTGEGGMVITDDDELADRLKVLSLHGISADAWQRFGRDSYRHYEVVEAGFKYNMMDLQAAIGLHQFDRLDTYWAIRDRYWSRYVRELAAFPIRPPCDDDARDRHGRHLFTVRVSRDACGLTRDEFLDAMTRQGIGLGVHYVSIPEHAYYRDRFGWNLEDYPHAVSAGRELVSLPLSARLTDADLDDVLAAIDRVLP